MRISPACERGTRRAVWTVIPPIGGVPFDLPGVETCPDLDPQRPQRVPDRERTADRRSGGIENRDEAVARRRDLAAAVVGELGSDDFVMSFQQRSPALVSHLGQAPRGSDDVREENRGEDPLGGGDTRAHGFVAAVTSLSWNVS